MSENDKPMSPELKKAIAYQLEDHNMTVEMIRNALPADQVPQAMRLKGPRYEHPGDGVIWLGSYGEEELFLAPQDPLPATLVARYGPVGPQYTTFNPKLLGLEALKQQSPAIIEAFNRALQLGYKGDLTRDAE